MLFEEVWSVEGWCVYCARGWRLCTSVGTTTERGSGCGVCRLWHAVDKWFHPLPYLKKLWWRGNSEGDDSDGDGDNSDGDGSEGDGSDGDDSDGSDGDEELMATHLLVSLYLYVHKLL